jgi:CO/xanthine dehydrogenase FAD-binding subunit
MVAYYRPQTLNEALALRASRALTVLAGGTDIYPAKVARAGWGDMQHGDVLDIGGLGELRGISETPAHWRFGALTTWSDLAAADLPPLFAGYQLAARAVGGRQIQNQASLVGNILTASPAGDGAPNLLVLEAGIELASLGGVRQLSLQQFLTGYRQTACRSDEIVTAILVPKPRRLARGHFCKLGARKYLVISIAMVAGVIEADAAGRILGARVAVGACSAMPQRLPALEADLAGQPLTAAAGLVSAKHLAGLAPIDDIRASAAYRRAAALALAHDLLAELAGAAPRRVA